MKKETRSKDYYASINAEDWRQYDYENFEEPTTGSAQNEAPKVEPTALNNKVHEVFSFKRQGSTLWRRRWTIEKFMSRPKFQSTILPVLRLASLMIMSPGSLVFLYGLLYSQREELREISCQTGEPSFTFRRPSGVLIEAMRQKVDEALKKLALTIVFSTADPQVFAASRRSSGLTVVRSPTIMHPACKIIDITDDPTCCGLTSQIVINRDLITALVQLHAQARHNNGQLQNLQFEMAKTLCRELTHALAYATNTHDVEKHKHMSKMISKGSVPQKVFQGVEVYFEDESGQNWGIAGRISYSAV